MSVGILITSRMTSTRLPGKALRPILGKPMLYHLVERLRLSRRADEIVLCTSDRPEDDPLQEAAEVLGIPVFRGDPVDVLERITAAAHVRGHETVVWCGADNPFTDPGYIDRLVDHHREEGNDMTRVEGLPWGTFAYALRRDAMDRACQIKATSDTEMWGEYFTRSGIFQVGTYRDVDADVRRPEIRLTVDTPDDFALAEAVFSRLGQGGRIFSLREIVALLDEHPELRRLNEHVVQAPVRPARFKPREQWDSEAPGPGD